MYQLADILLICSTRDGQNLVASEYIAARGLEHPGSLVISEHAGCAQSLAGAFKINPWSPVDIARGISFALKINQEEKKLRWETMTSYVQTFTAKSWCSTFLNTLQQKKQVEDNLVQNDINESKNKLLAA